MDADETQNNATLDSDVEEEKVLTPEQVRARFLLLRRTVMNEMKAPDILNYNEELVNYFMTAIKEHESYQDDVQDEAQKEIADLYQLDTERVKYYLQCYLRARLAKIEKYCFYFLSRPKLRQRLSAQEQEYAERYKQLIEDHMRESFLNELPAVLQAVDEELPDNNMIPKPNLDTHVFCKINRDIGRIRVDEETGQTAKLVTNKVYILPYSLIADFVHDGGVELL